MSLVLLLRGRFFVGLLLGVFFAGVVFRDTDLWKKIAS